MRNTSARSQVERSCPACGLTFLGDSRRIWCSDACRQRGFRLRWSGPDQALIIFPRRLPKDAVVYQCPACDQRYLGTQRCESCGTFCRRLGPGGPCPHCDEAVAVADLLPDAVAR